MAQQGGDDADWGDFLHKQIMERLEKGLEAAGVALSGDGDETVAALVKFLDPAHVFATLPPTRQEIVRRLSIMPPEKLADMRASVVAQGLSPLEASNLQMASVAGRAALIAGLAQVLEEHPAIASAVGVQGHRIDTDAAQQALAHLFKDAESGIGLRWVRNPQFCAGKAGNVILYSFREATGKWAKENAATREACAVGIVAPVGPTAFPWPLDAAGVAGWTEAEVARARGRLAFLTTLLQGLARLGVPIWSADFDVAAAEAELAATVVAPAALDDDLRQLFAAIEADPMRVPLRLLENFFDFDMELEDRIEAMVDDGENQPASFELPAHTPIPAAFQALWDGEVLFVDAQGREYDYNTPEEDGGDVLNDEDGSSSFSTLIGLRRD